MNWRNRDEEFLENAAKILLTFGVVFVSFVFVGVCI